MTSYGLPLQAQLREGVLVSGEAVWRVSPERAEFLVEISASAPTAAQALQENQLRSAQLTQALTPLGVQQTDLQTISLNVYNLYSQGLPALPPFGGAPMIGAGGFTPYAAGTANLQGEVQGSAYHARNLVRVNVRDPRRLGEILDAVSRTGAAIVSPLTISASDEASARRNALDAAGKDARLKAEALAAAAGKQLDDVTAIVENVVASNGVFSALRSAVPFAFGAGAPQVTGELEYYARITANFRLK